MGKIKIGNYELPDNAPITDYNRGFLEGAAWQEGQKKPDGCRGMHPPSWDEPRKFFICAKCGAPLDLGKR